MKRILCYGDSNTWGLIAGTTERYEWGVRWTSRLQNALSAVGFQVVEEGLCGRTTVLEDAKRPGRSGAALLPAILESHAPLDMVVLMLGTNDCKTVYAPTVESISKGVETLLRQIRDYAPNSKILLISPIALGEGVGEAAYDPEFDEHSVEISRALPDAYRFISCKWGIDYLAASEYAVPSPVDREHMDAKGHERLAKAVTSQIVQIFREDVKKTV